MAQKYYAIPTEIGLAAIANATVANQKVNITHFAVGDGNGFYYEPQPNATTLIKETWRGAITSCTVDQSSKNIINISAVIPSNIGGFTIREMGVFDDKNQLIAIANTPDTTKVAISEGVSSELEVTMQIILSHTDKINVQVDPTVILATKADLQKVKVEILAELRNHIENTNTHVSLDEKQLWNDAREKAIINADSINSLNLKTSQTNIRLSRLEDSLFNDIVGNPFIIDFKNLTGIKLIKGCWNKTLQRLEC